MEDSRRSLDTLGMTKSRKVDTPLRRPESVAGRDRWARHFAVAIRTARPRGHGIPLCDQQRVGIPSGTRLHSTGIIDLTDR